MNNKQSTHNYYVLEKPCSRKAWAGIGCGGNSPTDRGDAFEAANGGSMTNHAGCGRKSDKTNAASCISCCTCVHARTFFFKWNISGCMV